MIIGKGILFKYKGKASEVVLPDGVTTINKESFSNCSALQRVVFPQSLESVDNDWSNPFQGSICGCQESRQGS